MLAQVHYGYKLRTVWHPQPLSSLIHTDRGNIAVLCGANRGQLSSGQFVDI